MKLTSPVARTANRCPWVRYSAVRVHARVPDTSTAFGDDSVGAEPSAEGVAGAGAGGDAGATGAAAPDR